MFRKAAIDAQRMQFNGGTVEAQSFGAGLFTYFMAALIAVVAFYVFTADYSRTITVQGLIRPRAGLASVAPTRAGIISEIHVDAGDRVRKGAKIFTINPREGGLDTMYRDEPIADSLGIQAHLIRNQKQSAELGHQAEVAALELQKSKLQSEVDYSAGRLRIQRELHEASLADFERAKKIHASGFLSEREFGERKQRMLASKLELSKAEESLDATRAAVADLSIQIDRLRSQFMRESATLDASVQQVEQTILQIKGEGAYTLRAPISGTVTSLNVHQGERAEAQQEIAQIVPNGSSYEAQLYVLSDSIGFVRPGQKVRIGLDSFPFQKFGTISGQVREVSQSGAVASISGQQAGPYFIVNVDLDRQAKRAYGEDIKLLPGMTLKAWVIAEEQSFFDWLFSPLYAIQNR